MILSIAKDSLLYTTLDEIGFGTAIRKGGSVLIKINLSHPPQPLHPRTDPALLVQVLKYISCRQIPCALAEGADGFLQHNLELIGLGDLLKQYHVRVIDLDLEESECITVDDEDHYLPKCLKDYAVRLAFPATSKRPGMTFSNNIKLFVGAVPRRMYQSGEGGIPQARIHVDLHKSVANIYRAIMLYAPFRFFVNGGRAMFEDRGEIDLEETLVSDNALELDRYILDRFGIEPPGYLRLLETKIAKPGSGE